ncbi:MAG: helix-turn-helix transcriptional regulator [Bacillota bacterium]|nr:helix-turn-helix transcriptional regulator [Bacillota bacterium]
MEKKSRKFPIIDMEKTGKRIKELIQERGYTVLEIQRILMLSSHQTIYSWFSGINIPSIDNFVALSKLLEVPLEEMIVCFEVEEKRIQNSKIQEVLEDWTMEDIVRFAKQYHISFEQMIEKRKEFGNGNVYS